MVDTPEAGDSPKEKDTSSDFDSDFGEDWESAFQAEDYVFSPEDSEGDDIFLGEDKEADLTESSLGIPLDALESLADDTQAEIKPAQKMEGPEAEPPEPSQETEPVTGSPFQKAFSSLSTLLAVSEPLRQRFSTLPLYQRGIAVAFSAVFILLIAIMIFGPEKEAQIPSEPLMAEQNETAANDLSPKEAATDGLEQQDIPESGKTRVKWTFSPFLIAAASSTGEKSVSLVTVNLSLVMLLDEGADPPEEKKIFVRNIIYQFYNNRPLSELHRYSLARGEMKRKLEAWLLKQWPDSPIDTIIINRYQII